MIYLVIYDISDDPLRLKVSKFLKSKGLRRVQWSAFVGDLTTSQLRDVESGLTLIMKGKMKEGERRNVQIYPLTERQFQQRIVIGVLDERGEEDVLM